MPSLKVLCLHGYSQNKDFFKSKLGSLRNAAKNLVDFEFIDGPFTVECSRDDLHDGEAKGWWTNEPCSGSGVSESVKLVEHTLVERGPFDGILGFSQGAALLGVLVDLIERKTIKAPEVRFVILIAGYVLNENEDILASSLPSLHVIGDTDAVIAKDRSEALMKRFSDAELLSHTGGHYVPASKEFRSRYLDFFNRFSK